MMSFSKEQSIIDIGDTKFGGQPGELPTVLFGTVFYGKKYREPDAETLEQVRNFIRKQEEMGKMTGNPPIVDIYLGDAGTIGQRIELVLLEV